MNYWLYARVDQSLLVAGACERAIFPKETMRICYCQSSVYFHIGDFSRLTQIEYFRTASILKWKLPFFNQNIVQNDCFRFKFVSEMVFSLDCHGSCDVANAHTQIENKGPRFYSRSRWPIKKTKRP